MRKLLLKAEYVAMTVSRIPHMLQLWGRKIFTINPSTSVVVKRSQCRSHVFQLKIHRFSDQEIIVSLRLSTKISVPILHNKQTCRRMYSSRVYCRNCLCLTLFNIVRCYPSKLKNFAIDVKKVVTN